MSQLTTPEGGGDDVDNNQHFDLRGAALLKHRISGRNLDHNNEGRKFLQLDSLFVWTCRRHDMTMDESWKKKVVRMYFKTRLLNVRNRSIFYK